MLMVLLLVLPLPMGPVPMVPMVPMVLLPMVPMGPVLMLARSATPSNTLGFQHGADPKAHNE